MVSDRSYFSRCLVLALCLGVISLTGCAPSDKASNVASAATSAEMVAKPSPTGTEAASALNGVPEKMKGIYTWGAEVETLSLCNTNKTYWLEGSEQLLAPLQDMAMKKADAANEAYQPIYVEVEVVYTGKATDGFAVDYDGVMRLQSVQAASANVAPNCKLLDIAANIAQQ